MSPRECVRGLSKCPKTFAFYARDVRAGQWRRNALPVTNAGKSSNTSRLADITNAAVVDPEAKPHVPLQNTVHERRSQLGGTRKSIQTKNLDTSAKMERNKNPNLNIRLQLVLWIKAAQSEPFYSSEQRQTRQLFSSKARQCL